MRIEEAKRLTAGPARARRVARRGATREPGISSWITRAVLLEFESRGLSADRLLQRHGLTREGLFDPDAWIPQRCHAAFYRDAIAASGDPAFAIAVGRRAPLQFTRIAGHCAVVSDDLREAFANWGRYCELVGEGTRFGVRSTQECDAVSWHRLPALPALQDDEQSFATSALDFLAFAAGRVLRPLEIRFTGPVPPSSAAFVEALGAPVRWRSEHFELRFPAGTLDLPVRFSDPALRATLERAAQQELEMRSGGTVQSRVHAAILRIGFDRSASASEVATALGTSVRTLQRWLGDESLTFSGVRSAALRDAAVRMLAEEGATVPDVAFRLGFSSRNGFHRAIRRWTGKTPAELRGPATDGGRGRGPE